MPQGMVMCTNVAELPREVEAVSLHRKAKRVGDLVHCKSIRHLHANLDSALLPILTQLPSLEYLKLYLPKNSEVPSLSGLRTLRSLVLVGNKHQGDLESVRDMSWLHSFCVTEAVGISSLAPLASLTELRELYIDGKIRGRATIESLLPLAELKNLQFLLLLVRVAQPHGALKPLHQLRHLTSLHLSDEYAAKEYDSLIAAIPNLKQIRFNGGRRWPAEPAASSRTQS
jgi:hypothetical protein